MAAGFNGSRQGHEMKEMSRRDFLRTGATGAAVLAASPLLNRFPGAITSLPRLAKKGDLVFVPHPHPAMPAIDFVYASDEEDQPYKSTMYPGSEGIVVPEEFGGRRFGVNLRWYVEGFGSIWLCADNEGELYSLKEASGRKTFNLNLEIAKSRVKRNAGVFDDYKKSGTAFSEEVKGLMALSENLLEDAVKSAADQEKSTRLADKSLLHALWCGEKIELENAKTWIARKKIDGEGYFGCETRQYVWVKSEAFVKRFPELFNFATVTHYVWDSWYELFEPSEGEYNWGIKDDIVNWLSKSGITIEGRPLFWFHPSVTPEWMKTFDFAQQKKYVEKHARDLVSHYGDKVLEWEVINEYHDWANVLNNTPEQMTEIVRLACDTTAAANSKVRKIINNSGPFGEYVARGMMAGNMEADRPLRTPFQFLRELIKDGIDFDVLGIQVYFPDRDLSDIARLVDRFATLGKPIYITEIGATSGPSAASVGSGQRIPQGPYSWHRHWDDDLQAEWLEAVYSIYYSRPFVKAVNWYDFADFRTYIPNGGLVLEDCTPKPSFDRLNEILTNWHINRRKL